VNKKIVAVCITLAAMALAGSAHAQWTRQLYVGGGGGHSKFVFDAGSVAVNGATASTFNVDDDSSTAFKVYGGWRLNPFFAAEVGIVNFGTFSATRNVTAPAAGSLHSEIDVTGVYVDAVGFAPIGNVVELFGKVGLIATGTSATRSTTGSVFINGGRSSDDTASSTGLHAGLGMNLRITERVWIRLEYERAYNVGDRAVGEGDVSAAFIGAHYRF
jgi:OmpA-OmpF porin, OOP family